jgi:hypothetical protein
VLEKVELDAALEKGDITEHVYELAPRVHRHVVSIFYHHIFTAGAHCLPLLGRVPAQYVMRCGGCAVIAFWLRCTGGLDFKGKNTGVRVTVFRILDAVLAKYMRLVTDAADPESGESRDAADLWPRLGVKPAPRTNCTTLGPMSAMLANAHTIACMTCLMAEAKSGKLDRRSCPPLLQCFVVCVEPPSLAAAGGILPRRD